MKSRYFMLPLLTIVFCFSCTQEEPIPEAPAYPNVEQALWPYFQTFEEEAAARGLEIDLANARLSGEIDNLDDGNVIGLCQYGRYINNHITIDKQFWNRSSNLAREMVVFHELGHCFLGRDHLENAFRSGHCESIMRSGTCCCRDGYSASTRTYYVDELFEGN